MCGAKTALSKSKLCQRLFNGSKLLMNNYLYNAYNFLCVHSKVIYTLYKLLFISEYRHIYTHTNLQPLYKGSKPSSVNLSLQINDS